MTRTRALARILSLTSMSWFVLWSCAPMMSAPPSPPMPEDASREFGGGFNGTPPQLSSGQVEFSANGQFWLRDRVGEGTREERGLLFQVGWPSILSGGAYLRRGLGEWKNTHISYQVDGGLLWFGYSMPIATKLRDNLWLTTQPTARLSAASMFRVPVGLSWELGKKWRLDSEVGVHFGRISLGPGPMAPDLSPSYWLFYGGLGLSHHR